MKISELIEHLKSDLDDLGDVEVNVHDVDGELVELEEGMISIVGDMYEISATILILN